MKNNHNLKLYAALLVMGICPAIWTTFRTFLLGQLPGEYAYSIAGQLSWVGLFYEVVSEAIVLSMFFFMGKKRGGELADRVKSALVIAMGLFAIVSAVVSVFARPLLAAMATAPELIADSVTYIRLESIAYIFSVALDVAVVAIVTTGSSKAVYAMTAARLVMNVICDTMLVSPLGFSLNLGVNGIAISNIICSFLLACLALVVLARRGCNAFRARLEFSWLAGLARVGGISGAESLVRNAAYMLMISRMVNMVGEQGTYWVANNFIWGWLLLPVLSLGELIKKETAENAEAARSGAGWYFKVTGIICAVWILLIPLYKPFMKYILGFGEVDKLFGLVMVLLGFYVLFAFQNVFDAIFYGRGKTEYMLAESLITNIVYYGACFVLYLTGVFVPTLTGIALMFGIGNAFDAAVSAGAYAIFRRRER